MQTPQGVDATHGGELFPVNGQQADVCPADARASALQVAPSGGAARTGNVWMRCVLIAMLPTQLLATLENPRSRRTG